MSDATSDGTKDHGDLGQNELQKLRQNLAAARSHEDAKAANTLFQGASQAAILINGGASTAMLTFFATGKASDDLITPYTLAVSLACFAAGVFSGALVIVFQAVSVRHYAVYWQRTALCESAKKIVNSKEHGDFYGKVTLACFLASTICFLAGAIIIAFSTRALHI